MIDKEELAQIMKFVSEYWEKLKNDPDNDALKILPSKFCNFSQYSDTNFIICANSSLSIMLFFC